ncbi:NmrA family NAD(P)-binding protein [Frankia sp. AvcI1]|uniref:NmrA family NAD(P)-binding protein n=1 Tax=Frankia sp. AvcI1 TaxID=573496 RepID=UPI0006EBF605|nr:NmrA family NAD(P)-binding protein [Frankia sp. AvcI1]
MYLVTGATGNIGRELVDALAAAGQPVRALTRRGELPARPAPSASSPSPASSPCEESSTSRAPLEVVRGDLDRPETLAGPLAGVRGMFLLPGYRDMPGVLAEARRAGVEHVVLLSGSSAASGDRSNAVTDYMVRSEEAVAAAGVPWTVVRPFAFMSNTLRWLPQLEAGDEVREPFPDAPAAVIDPADIAAVAARVLTAPGGQAGAIHTVSGPQSLLPAERLRLLAERLGRPLRLVALGPDEARAELDRTMPAQYAAAMADFYLDGSLDESPVLPTVEALLGRPPRTYAQWLDTHAAEFPAARLASPV